MSIRTKYVFCVDKLIDGVDKNDFEKLEAMPNPFNGLEKLSRTSIDYSCKWNPRTKWFNECRPSFRAEGEVYAESLDLAAKKILEIFKELPIERIKIERQKGEIIDATYDLNEGDLVVSDRNISSNHPFYQKFLKMMDGR